MIEPPSASSLGLLPPHSRFWRLALLALVVIGLAGLFYLDRVLRREYRNGAVTQAAQTDALVESFVRQRATQLQSLATALAAAPSAEVAAQRFELVAPELMAGPGDVRAITYVARDGRILARHPAMPETTDASPISARADFAAARTSPRLLITGNSQLPSGGRGMLVYAPVLRNGRVVGEIVGEFAHGSLLDRVVGLRLREPFEYRVVDAAGATVARSRDYPDDVGTVERRAIVLPAGTVWQLEVPVPGFQPLAPRVLTWLVGTLLLLTLVALVLREEARAERFALHSLNLELLSRELIDANVRLEERAAQVTDANRAKSRFLANVSHELRTPVNAIVGYSALACEGIYGALSPELRNAHGRIHTAADHLVALVDDVLDLSKIEVGRMHMEVEPVDVAALLDSVVTVVEPVAAKKGVRVDVVTASNLPRLRTDPRHARQILLNLASNAIKFTEQGSVSLIAECDADEPERRVSIVVEDTGIGIAPQDLERIFDEFEQVRPGGRGDSQQRGTGLGLAIARKLARLLGGDVEVTSRVGTGSRFTLTLPVLPPPLEQPAAQSVPPPPLQHPPPQPPPHRADA